MQEEKMEENKEKSAVVPQAAKTVEPASPSPETPKAEASKQESPHAPGVQTPSGAPKEEKKEPAKITKEKPANCAGCNKSIRKKRWYYRNGKFYCSQRCWKTTVKKTEKPAETPVEGK